MATSNLNITPWVALQNQPEVPVNRALDILDGFAGLLTHNMASAADYTLAVTGTPPYEWQHLAIQITDTGVVLSGPQNIICPAYTKLYAFVNNTLQQLTLKTSGGTGIAVNAGTWALLYCDGTNVIRLTGNASTT